jgi:hypothetical protein
LIKNIAKIFNGWSVVQNYKQPYLVLSFLEEFKLCGIVDKYTPTKGLVTVEFVKPGDKFCQANGQDHYLERSCCSGNNICIGLYKNKEHLLISFFHELGHIIDPRTQHHTQVDCECRAWTFGLWVARNEGYHFSLETLEWADDQLQSYNDKMCYGKTDYEHLKNYIGLEILP